MSLYFVIVGQFTCLSAKTIGIDPACRKIAGDLLAISMLFGGANPLIWRIFRLN